MINSIQLKNNNYQFNFNMIFYWIEMTLWIEFRYDDDNKNELNSNRMLSKIKKKKGKTFRKWANETAALHSQRSSSSSFRWCVSFGRLSLSLSLSVILTVGLSVCRSICLSVYLSVGLSVCRFLFVVGLISWSNITQVVSCFRINW